jgi:hypothetical protein
MEEFVNKEKTENHIGVVDDIGKDMLQSQIDSYKEELDSYYEAVIDADKSIENYNNQWIIDKRLMELELENFGRREEHYVMKVHTIPEFWELQKSKFRFTIRQEEAKAENYLQSQLNLREKALERITVIESNLKKAQERLEE